MKQLKALPLLLAVLLVGCGQTTPPADLVILGGSIITMDAANPVAEALAARGQRIVAVGDEEDVRAYIGPDTEVLDLQGGTAYPGFIDAHAHFLSVGAARLQLDLRTAESWAEIVDMVAAEAAVTEPGAWIRGRGWHQEKWRSAPDPNIDGLPVHDALSAVSPDNPVFLTHASGHAVMVNARAMQLAGINDDTPNPPGGEIVRSTDGRAIGVLRETAEALVAEVMESEPVAADIDRQIELATAECLRKGLTSFQDAGSTVEEARFLLKKAEAKELGIRLSLMLSEPNEVLTEHLDELRIIGAGDGYLTIRGIKRWIDGALGSHGAWLLEPYADLPSSSGLNTEPLEAMRETARLAIEHGYQFCVHAIGDRANRETLDIFEEAFKANPQLHDLRWRVEHAQHLHPDDVPRFAELGVVASMQPVHCVSDGPWVPQRLGEKRSRDTSYLWRDLLDSGARIASGTDAPVEDVDPLATFRAAVTRDMGADGVFFPEQAMTRQEALRSMTLDAAWAVFEENDKGSLEVGKLADVTVLSDNILEVERDALPTVQVNEVIVGGKIRYRRSK